MTTENLPEHVRRNRAEWDAWAAEYAEWAPRAWAQEAFSWGTFSIPEADIGALPDPVAGMDVIELGCGTAYISAWLARMGANPVGIDNSPKQLETARAMQERFDLHFPLHLGNAEDLPFPDASFDLAISEYGASIWCDPMKWLPEAARVLRPGGWLVFLVNGVLVPLCSSPDDTSDTPVGTQLRRPLFGMYRIEVTYDDAVDFHLPHGQMIRVLRDSGFEIEQLIEPQPPENATALVETVPLAWARQWPSEEIWVTRKR
jgi:ubiquinone/menaquinone biosynthesis C-methylase UbiE